jgi:hypothetical protein
MVVGLRIARKREFENCILGGGIESDSDFGKKIFHIKEGELSRVLFLSRARNENKGNETQFLLHILFFFLNFPLVNSRFFYFTYCIFFSCKFIFI